MNRELLKDYYSINEACSFMSEKLNESFKPFDILFSMGKHDINLCFYHSGFIGVADWYRVIGEILERRIPFDGILVIPHISHIQEVLETEEIFVSDVEPSYWVRHKDKKIRLVEELLKFEEPTVRMVDYSNSIIAKNIPINALIITDDSLIRLIGIFKNKITSIDYDINGKTYLKSVKSNNEFESKSLNLNQTEVSSVTNETIYSTSLLKIQDLAVNEFFYPRKSVDAKQEEVTDWIIHKGNEFDIIVSDNVASAMFTIIKPIDHNPRIRRG